MRAHRAGAANYIPKKDLARDLVETVRGILRMSTVDRHRRRLLHCLNCRESTFLLENDPNLIASLMELVQEELDGLDVHFVTRSSVLIDLDYSGSLWERGSSCTKITLGPQAHGCSPCRCLSRTLFVCPIHSVPNSRP